MQNIKLCALRRELDGFFSPQFNRQETRTLVIARQISIIINHQKKSQLKNSRELAKQSSLY